MPVLLIAALLAAAPAPPPAAIALTVSGGVSLGAYEAGYLYYTTAVQAANPELPRLRVATGASAGSVNALLGLQASCGGGSSDPRQSLFYRVWIPMGLKQLYQPDSKDPLAAFSQDSFARVGALVEQELARGLPEGCDVVLGVAASRLSPRLLSAANGLLEVPVTEERFAVRIRGRGPGRMPLLTNYVDPEDESEQAMLPEGADGSIPFANLLDAVIASTSFPGAFPPRSVKHCVVATLGRAPPYCPESAATSALFVDGGVFDNSPLRLAATLAAGGMTRARDGSVTWKDAPRLHDPGSPPPDISFAFISADAAAFPDQLASSDDTADPALLPLLVKEMGGFVSSARSHALYLLLQEYPDAAANLVYPRRHFPAASSPMYAFFGFFDRGFRSYDFDLGMYEARRFIAGTVLPRFRTEVQARFKWPEDQPPARAAGASWASFSCLQAVFDGNPEAPRRCAGEALRSERILAQVSLDRLWNRCLPYSRWEPAPKGFGSCRGAQTGEPPPRVPGVEGTPDWHQATDESEAVQMTRLLAAYGYDWTELDVPRGAPPPVVLAALRGQLAAVVDHLAEVQPSFGQRVALGGAGKLAVDLFYYVPPARSAWVTLGRPLEVGGDWAFDELSWLRATAGLEILNLLSSLGSDSQPVAFTPVAGLSAVPRSIGSPVLQPSFLLRGGYVLSPNDDFGASPCQGQDRVTLGACSRPTVELGAAATVTGVLRVQVLGQWYPPAWGLPGLWSITPSLGFQLGY
jgi:predicted acylesterase/phospholipase RssA